MSEPCETWEAATVRREGERTVWLDTPERTHVPTEMLDDPETRAFIEGRYVVAESCPSVFTSPCFHAYRTDLAEDAPMSAETLRRAAALMRERAEAACPSPWRLGEHSELGPYEVWGNDDRWNASEVATTLTRLNRNGTPSAAPNAAHIASWHPAVALTVASWLDGTADEFEDECPSTYGDALTVARAYLGEAR